MEFLSYFAEAFSDGIDGFVSSFTALFQYFISIGVRQETLILILIGGGVSFLLILVALFMAMSKVRLKRGGAVPKKQAAHAAGNVRKEKNKSRFSAMFSPKNREHVEAVDRADAADAQSKHRTSAKSGSGKGFTIFKKRKKPSRLDREAREEARNAQQSHQPIDGVMSKLTEIERDMLALKELYQAGHITIDVYVTESKTLYEKAKALS